MAQVKFDFDPEVDVFWYKMCSNDDTIVCVAELCHNYYYYADAEEKDQIAKKVTDIVKAQPQPNKGLLMVHYMEKPWVEEGVTQVAQYLQTHSSELIKGDIVLFRECCACNLPMKWAAPCPLLDCTHASPSAKFEGVKHTLASLDEKCDILVAEKK